MRSLLLIVVCVKGCRGNTASDDTPPIDGAQLVPLTPDEATNACVVFGSCLGDGINDCFTDAMPFWTVTEARCMLAAAGDCTAARACLGQSITQDPSCIPGVGCDGDTRFECSNGLRVTVTCPTASPLLGVGTGSTCVMTDANAFCGDATCSVDSATCAGDVASACLAAKGFSVSLDCAAYGQSCSAGACTAPNGGSPCSPDGASYCRGRSLARCVDGVEATIDCAVNAENADCFPGGATSPDSYCGFADTCFPCRSRRPWSGSRYPRNHSTNRDWWRRRESSPHSRR